jgi:hypothetical protein
MGSWYYKNLDTGKKAELPEPEMQELDGGFSIPLSLMLASRQRLC